MILNGHSVGESQCFCSVRAGAHSIHRAPARFYPNKIISQVVQLLFDLGLSSFAYRDDVRSPTTSEPADDAAALGMLAFAQRAAVR